MAIDVTALGNRIAVARIEAGLTQAELAHESGLNRTALAKIETGIRGVSALELARIAQAVQHRLEWFLTEGPAAIVSHRVRRGSDSAVAPIDRELERLAEDVEFVLAQAPSFTVPAREAWEVPGSLTEADDMAARARRELGLDESEPALNLAELFSPLGLLVFVAALGSETADGGTVLLEQGGVCLVNGSSDLGRRRMTAAHELAHFLVADDYTIDWRIAEGASSERVEALFDRFARTFLMPEAALTAYWQSVSEEELRAAAVQTANHFRVDMSTLSRRLIESGVLSQEEASRVRMVRTTKADMLDYGLFVPYELEERKLPAIYEKAVLSLYRGERINQDRTLDLLRGKYGPEDLPELTPAREDELWTILS